MNYTLAEVDLKIKRFADKQGSDYFPLPVILDYFHTATYNFITERLKEVEKTQEVTDDIRPLVGPVRLNSYILNQDDTRHVFGLPHKYLRLLSYDVVYTDGTRCRRADLIRQGEYKVNTNNPFRKPSKYYPIILQENNLFVVDSGEDEPDYMVLIYCKKPTFATTADKNKRIVNLPDESIEEIILDTVTRLFNSTGDERSQSNYQLQEAFRQFDR